MMSLTAEINEFSSRLAAQTGTPGLLSATILILILSILGLLLLSLVLLRSVRKLKPRPIQRNEPEPRLQDPWLEAGRRMQVDDPPSET